MCDVLGTIAKKYVYKWSITQSLDITAQLQAGIRYFDLRIAAKKGSNECFCVHGLYGANIDDILKDISRFLDKHPKEVVLLDFNHFYEMDQFKHKQLMSHILEVLGYKMCPFLDVDSLTLNTLWENNLQVIVFYHVDIVEENAQFWPGSQIPSPWPNTMKADDMVKSLDKSLTEVRPTMDNAFFVFQGVLTPSTNYVVSHLNKSLKTMSSKACKPYVEWIQTKKAGKNGINVCIMDFVEWGGYIESVIKLNDELSIESIE